MKTDMADPTLQAKMDLTEPEKLNYNDQLLFFSSKVRKNLNEVLLCNLRFVLDGHSAGHLKSISSRR